MIFFTGQRRFGKWAQQVHTMGECWLRGETTALLTSQVVNFEQRPTKRSPDALPALAHECFYFPDTRGVLRCVVCNARR